VTGRTNLGHTFFPKESMVLSVVLAASAGVAVNNNTALGGVANSLEDYGLSGEASSTTLIAISSSECTSPWP
jgi:hypothetical protein